MRAGKAPRAPGKLGCLTLLPLLFIGGFTLLVVWQWSGHRAFEGSEHYQLDRARGLSASSLPVRRQDESPERSSDLVIEEEGEGCRCEEVGEETAAVNRRAGSLPLRNESDVELYRRVLDAESTRRARLSSDGSKEDDRDGGEDGRRAGASESCRRHCAQQKSGDQGDSKGNGETKAKVAFLFMITTSVPFAPLWNKYFEGHEGLYNVYVHADPFNASLFELDESAGVFRGRLIPSQKAFRGSPSLVLASNRLLAHALLDDQANSHFALLSGACTPVRSFPVAYRKITASRGSFLEQIRNESIMWERYTGRGGADVMRPEIPFEQFRKAAQWFVFARRHALLILRDVQERKYWSKFDHECKIYFCGTDEHYYPTLLNIVDPAGVSGTSVTYVRWPDYVSEHPVVFRRYDVNASFIADIQQQHGQQYLFARKFVPDTLDLLMKLNQTLLS